MGFLFFQLRNNLPNTVDVYIGRRIGDTLHIHTKKQIRKGTDAVKYKQRMIPIIPTETNLFIQHLNWENELHIVDEDWGSDILGIQEKYIKASNEKGIPLDIEKMEEEIKKSQEDAKKNHKSAQIKFNINPIFMISATKIYKWVQGHMLDASFGAIIKSNLVKTGMIGFIILGVIMGGMGGYIVVSKYQTPLYLTSTSYITCPPITNISETTSLNSNVPAYCASYYLGLTNSSSSSQFTTSSTKSTTTATIVAISSFNNGTIDWKYSNGTLICKVNC